MPFDLDLSHETFREHLELVHREVERLTDTYERKLQEMQDSYEKELAHMKANHELVVKKLRMQARAIFESYRREVAERDKERLQVQRADTVKEEVQEVLNALAIYENLRLENSNK